MGPSSRTSVTNPDVADLDSLVFKSPLDEVPMKYSYDEAAYDCKSKPHRSGCEEDCGCHKCRSREADRCCEPECREEDPCRPEWQHMGLPRPLEMMFGVSRGLIDRGSETAILMRRRLREMTCGPFHERRGCEPERHESHCEHEDPCECHPKFKERCSGNADIRIRAHESELRKTVILVENNSPRPAVITPTAEPWMDAWGKQVGGTVTFDPPTLNLGICESQECTMTVQVGEPFTAGNAYFTWVRLEGSRAKRISVELSVDSAREADLFADTDSCRPKCGSTVEVRYEHPCHRERDCEPDPCCHPRRKRRECDDRRFDPFWPLFGGFLPSRLIDSRRFYR